jgi:hypothetical protein
VPRADQQARCGELLEVARHVRLALAQRTGEFGHRGRTRGAQCDETQPQRIGRRAQHAGKGFGCLFFGIAQHCKYQFKPL